MSSRWFPRVRRSSLAGAGALAVALTLAACSDPQVVSGGDGPVAARDGSSDGQVPDSGMSLDQGGGDVALQAIINTVTPPYSKLDFARDLDGDGTADNRLGQIFGALVGSGGSTVWSDKLALQRGLDKGFEDGTLIMLTEVRATGLLDADPAYLQLWMGEDTNTSPVDNFTGGVFRVAPGSPTNAVLAGKISNQRLSTTATIRAPLPVVFPDQPLPIVTIKLAHVEGRVGADGIAAGTLAGAVPIGEFRKQVVAPLAGGIKDYFAKQGNPSMGDLVVGLIDTAVVPDIDTDGDGKKDAFSFALGFTAVPATILR